jgi:hypothetical protein
MGESLSILNKDISSHVRMLYTCEVVFRLLWGQQIKLIIDVRALVVRIAQEVVCCQKGKSFNLTY